jgi:DNA polymerase-3 subunit alpha
VRPPDVQKSLALFAVETDADGTSAIRFGLAAIKNVGEGAIEAIVAAREGRSTTSDEAGPFANLDDLCRRVDLHTVNKRVVESLVKAGAMASLGSQGLLLNRLDTALEAGQRHQRDVAAGQGTLFDLFAMPVEPVGPVGLAIGPGEASEPVEDDVPRRERLRWEKELLGLYLSEHPLGEIESVLPEYVTAYVGDLAEESDQSKVTLGGIIAGSRRIITRAGSTMLVATLEDLTGSTEVVVFPKVFADTANSWTDDAVVLVTGRVDHRDEGSQLLCEAVHAWDDAVRMGPVAFGAERDRLLRMRGGGRGPGGNGAPYRNGNGNGHAIASPPPLPIMEPAREPAPESAPESDDAAVPADARPLATAPAAAGTIEIGFEDGLSMDRLLPAIESVTAAIRGRPGPMPVVISIPVAGATRQVRLPERVEWDDRLAEVVRRAAGLPVAVELRPVRAEA